MIVDSLIRTLLSLSTMILISSSNSPTSFDHVSSIGPSFAFESCIDVVKTKTLSAEGQGLFLQSLLEHPEWLNQCNSTE